MKKKKFIIPVVATVVTGIAAVVGFVIHKKKEII
jgi:predicted small secreted protein